MKLPASHFAGQAQHYNGLGKQLLKKQGWVEGNGLGVQQQGVAHFLKPSAKSGNAGVGASSGAATDWSDRWWERMFDSAAQAIAVQNTADDGLKTEKKLTKHAEWKDEHRHGDDDAGEDKSGMKKQQKVKRGKKRLEETSAAAERRSKRGKDADGKDEEELRMMRKNKQKECEEHVKNEEEPRKNANKRKREKCEEASAGVHAGADVESKAERKARKRAKKEARKRRGIQEAPAEAVVDAEAVGESKAERKARMRAKREARKQRKKEEQEMKEHASVIDANKNEDQPASKDATQVKRAPVWWKHTFVFAGYAGHIETKQASSKTRGQAFSEADQQALAEQHTSTSRARSRGAGLGAPATKAQH